MGKDGASIIKHDQNLKEKVINMMEEYLLLKVSREEEKSRLQKAEEEASNKQEDGIEQIEGVNINHQEKVESGLQQLRDEFTLNSIARKLEFIDLA